jgi:hypothetical protein
MAIYPLRVITIPGEAETKTPEAKCSKIFITGSSHF